MLKNLIKYELKSTARLFFPLYLLTVFMGLFTRVFSSLSIFKDGIMAFVPSVTIFAYVVILLATCFSSFAINTYRFYKNYVTDEGYLMFTLPVKTSHLILSKLLVAMIWTFASVVVVFISLAIVFFDSYIWTESINMFRAIYLDLYKQLGNAEAIISYSFLTISAVISLAYNMLFVYLSIALGQLILKKHEILGSIAAYFALNTVLQIVSSILLGLFMLLVGEFETLARIFYWFTPCMAVFSAFICFAIFKATEYLLKNRLNLE